MRILYVDDDAESFAIVYRQVSKYCELHWLPHVVYAHAILPLIHYDLVIVDMFGTFSEDLHEGLTRFAGDNVIMTSAVALGVGIEVPFVEKIKLKDYLMNYIKEKDKILIN